MSVDKQIFERVISNRTKILDAEVKNKDKFTYRLCGKYVQTKLEYVRKYLYIYTKIVSSHFPEIWYIEPESGPGCCQIEKSGRLLLGSPLLALSNEPFFQHYRFIEKDSESAKSLMQRIETYFPDKDAEVKCGDCNILLEEILKEIPDKNPFLAFIDPKGLEFKMSTLKLISEKEKAEFYINYPYNMAVLRCISPDGYEATQQTVTEYFGGEEWIPIRDDLYNEKITQDEAEKRFLKLYISKINDLGFENISYSNVILNDTHHPLYYLIQASHVPVAKKTMKQVMKVGKDYKQIQKQLFDL